MFYEDFVKKLKECNFEMVDTYSFRRKNLTYYSGILLGIIMSIIAIVEIYLSIKTKNNLGYLIAVLFIYSGVKYLKKSLDGIKIENNIIKYGKVEIAIQNIESCTLKESPIGKRVEITLDIITKNKEQFIIPLFMNEDLKFVYLIKNKIDTNSFKIQK